MGQGSSYSLPRSPLAGIARKTADGIMDAHRILACFVVVAVLAARVQAEPGCPGSKDFVESTTAVVAREVAADLAVRCSFFCWHQLYHSFLQLLLLQ